MWFESIHVRIRACMLTQTGFLFDFPSVSLWPVCYLLIETDNKEMQISRLTQRMRPGCFCASGLMITDAL